MCEMVVKYSTGLNTRRGVARGGYSLGRGAWIRLWNVDVKPQARKARHPSRGGRRGRRHLQGSFTVVGL